MEYAIVEDGVVGNVIVSDAEFAAGIGAVLLPDGFGIGDFFDGMTWTKAPAPAPPPPTAEQVNAERDRRIDRGFVFGGNLYQSRPEDRENISGASVAALSAIMSGATAGNYLWHGGASPFVWIAADNSEHQMDAQTMFAFGQAAMAHKQANIFAARAIKDTDPIPTDYTGDSYWP